MDRTYHIVCTDLEKSYNIKSSNYDAAIAKLKQKLLKQFGGIGYTTISVSYMTLNGQQNFSTNVEVK